jgi:hypothetical protein
MKRSKVRKDQIITRVSGELKKFLENESIKQDVSTSNYVERVLRERQEWEKISHELKLIEIFRELFVDLLQRINPKDIEEIGSKILVDLIRNAIIYERGEMTLDSLLNNFDNWALHNNMNFRRLVEGNNETFIFRHSLGKNFSIMTYKALEDIINQLKFIVKSKEISDEMLIFDIIK